MVATVLRESHLFAVVSGCWKNCTNKQLFELLVLWQTFIQQQQQKNLATTAQNQSYPFQVKCYLNGITSVHTSAHDHLKHCCFATFSAVLKRCFCNCCPCVCVYLAVRWIPRRRRSLSFLNENDINEFTHFLLLLLLWFGFVLFFRVHQIDHNHNTPDNSKMIFIIFSEVRLF